MKERINNLIQRYNSLCGVEMEPTTQTEGYNDSWGEGQPFKDIEEFHQKFGKKDKIRFTENKHLPEGVTILQDLFNPYSYIIAVNEDLL